MGYKIKYDPILDEFVFDHGFGDRIIGVENATYYIEIFEEVSSPSGTLTLPTGATIVLDQYAEDIDSLCRVITSSGQKPLEQFAQDASGNLITVALSGTGNADYTLSGTPTGSQYAVCFIIEISEINLRDVDKDTILQAEEVQEPFTVLKFNTTSTHQVEEGEVAWSQEDGTLNVGMPGGNVVGQMFQELYVPKRPRNVSGSIMPNGTVVFISGETGAVPEISLADASTEALSMATIGLTTEEIAVSGRGYVTTVGLVRDVDTSTFASGAAVWLSETAGEFTDTKPSAPAHAVMIGTVNRVHDTEGEILLNIANGWETYELHDVDDIIPTVTGQNWTWDVASGYYKLRTSRLYDDNNWSFQPSADSTTAWQLKDQAGNEAVNHDSINDILNISGVDPEIRLTDTGNNEYTRITKSDTDNVAQRFNRISSTINKALDFDGAGDYVNVPHDASFNFGTGDFTMFTWIRNTQNPAQHNTVFCKGDPESANEWCFQVLNSKYLNFRTNATGYTSSITIVDGVDTLIGVTRVGTTLKLYSNNVEVGSFTSSDNLTNSEDLHIGYRGVAYNGYLNAVTDESGIYSRGLTSDDFTDLYNSGAGLYVDKAINFPTSGTSMGLNLEALWHYDQSSGTSLPDSSVNSNIGTLINMDDSDWVAGKVTNPSLVILEVNVWKSFDSGYLWGDSILPTVFEGTALGFNNLSPVAFLDAVIPLSTQVGDLLTGAVSQSANLRENRKSDGTLYSGTNNIGERFNNDNVKNWFGTGNDASEYYDGTDPIINPKEVGTGQLKILGHALFDTSHGELYETGGTTDITITTPGTYVQWVSTTVGLESGANYVVGDITNDRLTIGSKGGGRYRGSYHSSVILEPGQCLEAAVFKNGTIIPNSICRQTSPDNPHVHADSVSLVVGTLVSGTVANTRSWDGTYYIVQEIVATPGLVYDYTFTDAENLTSVFEFRGRYNGSAVHNIKVQAYNNNTTTWDNLTAAADDLPSYVSLDYAKRFKITGTLADYYDGSDQVLIRINHSSNGSTSHQVFNDEISMIRDKAATIMNFSFYDDLVATDYVDLRFTCPINAKIITPSETNLSIERMNR